MPPDESTEPPRAEVLLGLGANLGDPRRQLAAAVARLRALIEDVRVSSVYRTEPVGHRDQPDFYNLVLGGWTRLPPEALLREMLAIERDLGRERTFANAPRTIDIDLLAYGDVVMRTPELTLPHPGIAHRGFVLHPLAEVAPAWVHPVLGRTARELLSAAGPLERVEQDGRLDED
ncbi:2-amino-4-hydroxy-6-hydroxymethyldihydropteridinediphosphokinase [bacterium JGI 053]|nr:2-amino-4-hydroxy-6-hydroxymethyldihydropteridinediphosphokinase [bacterium JGI 053]